jgi:hypothetical protein
MSIVPLIPTVGAAVGASAGLLVAGAADGLRSGQAFYRSLSAALHPSDRDEATASAAGAEEALYESQDLSLERLSQLQRDIDELHRQLMQSLAARGVDLSIPVELKTGHDGQITVDDPHPQRAAIEQLFRENRELAAAFQYVAAANSAEHALRGTAEEDGWGEFRLRLDQNGGRAIFE